MQFELSVRCGASLALLAFISACATDSPDAADNAARPSIVLIVADTLRADHLGAYGYRLPTSPNLDGLAEDGFRFERCAAQSTWTKPATASILTGRYPSEHGATAVNSTLHRGVPTLAERFQAAGYRTQAFVTNGMVASGPVGFARGFDAFTSYFKVKNRLGYERAETVIDDVLVWLETATEEPFFLYIHLLDPHDPYDPPGEFSERFANAGEGRLDGYFESGARLPQDMAQADWDRLIGLYDGEIAYMDEQLGRLFGGLRRLGLYDPSAIVFLSDHGEEFGDHGSRGHPSGMYEEVLHVPLLLKPPGSASHRKGVVVPHRVQQVDVVPTLMALASLPEDSELAGTDLLALADTPLAPRIAFSEVDRGGVMRKAVYFDRQKYIRAWTPKPKEFLFDLGRDPEERTNRVHDDDAEALSGALDRFLIEVSEGIRVEVLNESDEPIHVEVEFLVDGFPAEKTRIVLAEETGSASSAEGIDGPIQWELIVNAGQSAYRTVVHLRATPGDRDGVVIVPDVEEGHMLLQLRVDGRKSDPALVFLGKTGTHPVALPLNFDLAGIEELAAVGPFTPASESDRPFSFFVYCPAGVRTDAVELPDEIVEQLSALGYGE